MTAAAVVVLALSVVIPGSAAADSSASPNGCHGAFLQLVKNVTGTRSTAAIATEAGESVQDFQKFVDAICQSAEG